ncbi:radical SAM protein [Clostridium sp. AF19-22AC]|jgi:DNA repair photolyase|uniref:DNA repair photolyase n=1 Tax=Faecalicatena orotica TaxID=1544 RepID=A0A2Y9BF19_9FIRM|nr:MULTISPECIES: radical SAM protein [Clostridia]PWJ30711.1 DNA repair photolyase [Faecalicatena orotica]RHR32529.1 radical SAM protein [Clostridium sp. AF19-22AC]SSA54872.1 DNA repair photolyase [Faecalicatena orotica]
MEYIPAKTIITRSKKPEAWFGTEYNMNIYKGCCHGCIYCDSRSECYGVSSFDTVRAKENALQIIRDELRRKTMRGVISTGAMSDPYNPFEKKLELTRHALELCNAFEFGIAIATKSVLLERDIDVLSDIREHSPVLCKITITTSDDALSKKLEPGVPVSSERFRLIRKLSDQGIYTGILLMPVLPFIEDTDENICEIVRMAGEAGARFIYPAFGMTLRDNQREWYYEKLNCLFPDKDLVTRYQKRFGNSYECRSPRARQLWRVFEEECKKAGVLYRMKDIISSYRRPYKVEQLSLFDL